MEETADTSANYADENGNYSPFEKRYEILIRILRHFFDSVQRDTPLFGNDMHDFVQTCTFYHKAIFLSTLRLTKVFLVTKLFKALKFEKILDNHSVRCYNVLYV